MHIVAYRLSPGIALETFPDETLLFAEASQQLHTLNACGGTLANSLITGASIEELEATLAANGIERPTAKHWVEAFLVELARDGMIVADPLEGATAAEQFIEICGSMIRLRYGSRSLFANLAPDYAHLQTDPGEAHSTYDIYETNRFILISGNGRPAVAVEPLLAAVQLKSMILEEQIASRPHLAALHAACLVRDGKALLLLGEPGAGKSTLTLALLARGYSYASDDVTLLYDDGRVEGVPLALGVKERGWDTAQSFHPVPQSSHLRPDGQRLKFIPVNSVFKGSSPVYAIVNLRRDGSIDAELVPVTSAECLRAIFHESRSANGRCSIEIMRSLSVAVRRSIIFELRYREASTAADCIGDILQQ